MILYGNEAANLYSALRYVAENGEVFLHMHGSLRETILDDKYKHIWENLDQYIDKILEVIPKSQKRKARRALKILREMYMEVSKIKKNPPKWLLEYAVNRFLSGYAGTKPEIIIIEHLDKIINIFPLEGIANREAIVLRPTIKELEKVRVELEDAEWAVSDLLDTLSYMQENEVQKSILQINKKEQVVVAIPKHLFYRTATDFDIKKNIALQELEKRGIKARLEKIGVDWERVERSYGNILLVSTRDVAVSAFDNGKAKETIEIIISYKNYEKGRVEARLDGKIYGTKVSVKTTTLLAEPSTLKFSRLEEIPEAVLRARKIAEHYITAFRQLVDMIMEKLGSQDNTEWSIECSYHEYTPNTPHAHIVIDNDIVTHIVRKKIDENVEAEVKLKVDLSRLPPSIKSATVSAKIYDDTRKVNLEDVLARIADMYNAAHIVYKNYGEVDFGLEPVKYSYDKIIREAVKMAEDLAKEYREQLKQIEEARNKTAMNIEKYVALFAYITAGGPVYLIKTIGRKKQVMYSQIANLVKKILPVYYLSVKEQNATFPVETEAYNILRKLVEKGYIFLSKDGVVRINGKKLTDLLKGILSEKQVENANELVAEKILYYMCRQQVLKCLEEKDLLSEKTFWLTFRISRYSNSSIMLTPEDFTAMINGKPVWELVPSEKQREIIESFTLTDLAEILVKPHLRKLFHEYIGWIWEKIMSSEEASLVTKCLYHVRPDLLGPLSFMKPYETEGFFGIDTGNYVVQVEKILPEKYVLIVYHKELSAGFKMEAENLSELIFNIDEEYKKYYEEYRKLEELEPQLLEVGVRIYRIKNTSSLYIPYLASYDGKIKDEYIRPGLAEKYRLLLGLEESNEVKV